MKHLTTIFIAAIIIGVVCFAVMHYMLGEEINFAINAAICAACGAVIAEYIRLYLEKKKRNNITGR
jgi:small basic protein